MAKLTLEHPNFGIIKTAPVGFSFTTLLFPSLPALFRGDFKGFIIQLLLAFLIIPALIFPFIYNKQYIQALLAQGYKVKSVDGSTIDSVRRRLGINLQMLDAGGVAGA